MSEMRRLWMLWKVGGSKVKCLETKKKALQAAYTVKRNAEKERFASIQDNKENNFHVANQMCTENQDVIGEKCVRGDDVIFYLDGA